MSGYRETALSCPACAELLDARAVGDAIIDVCPGCAGIWVDWFDGELTAMVAGAPQGREGAVRGAGDSGCPRCATTLEREGYLDSGVVVLRCSECSGAFVPRASADRLLASSAPPAPEEKSALGRLRDVLRALFGLG